MANELLDPVDPVETEEEKKKKKTLAATMPPVKLEKPEYYIAQMNALNQDPRFNQEASDTQKKTLAQAMRKAEEMYGERETRNEWLEVAQMIGRAGAQFGAAQSGMKSGNDRNMSNLSFIPPVDYEKRTDRASRDYEQQLRNLSTQKQLTDADSKETYRREFEPHEQGLKAALEKQRLSERGVDESRSIANTDYSRAVDVIDTEDKTLSGAVDKAAKRETASIKLRNMITNDGADSKTLRKYEEQYPGIAAEVGINLPALEKKLDDAETLAPGFLGGKTSKEEDEAKKKLIDEELAPLQADAREKINLLAGIRKIKTEMAQGKLRPKDALDRMQALKGGEQQTPSTVKVRGPSGQIAEMTPENAAKYLSKEGYSKVD